MPNWKIKRANNFEPRKKISNLIGILGIITHAIFLTENFKEVIQKINHIKTLLSQEIKNLQIITITMLKITNVRNW